MVGVGRRGQSNAAGARTDATVQGHEAEGALDVKVSRRHFTCLALVLGPIVSVIVLLARDHPIVPLEEHVVQEQRQADRVRLLLVRGALVEPVGTSRFEVGVEPTG